MKDAEIKCTAPTSLDGSRPIPSEPCAESAQALQRAASRLQLVTFRVGDTQVGIDIHQVSCLVRMVEITEVPRSPSYMLGIINVRGQIVPVISLHRLFRCRCPTDPLSTYILVARTRSQPIGLPLDSLTHLVDVDQEQMEPSSRSDPLSAILSWTAKHEEGILFVLDPERLVAMEDVPELAAGLAGGEAEALDAPLPDEVRAVLHQRAAILRQATAQESVASKSFLTFALGNEKYAVMADHVERVLAPPEIVSVPGTPPHFVGMLNHAGDVLWVLAPKTLLALPPSLPGNDERVLILNYGSARFGLLIDASYDVANFPSTSIRGPLLSGERTKDDFVAGQIYWRDELIGVLDFSALSAEKVLRDEE